MTRLNSVFVGTIAVWWLVAFASTVGAGEPAKPGAKDRCPVCGMFVAPFPNWIGTVVFTDGSQVFFDGPKDLFQYYFEIAKYDKNRTGEDVADLFVTEYYTTKIIRAAEAYYVVGSDVMGPMGHELVPIQGRPQAEVFLLDHKGQKVLSFADLSLDQVTNLR